MSHLNAIRSDNAYAEILANWDEKFYLKYTDAVRPSKPGGRVLDVGCGVGQVVARLTSAGFEAHGVDVSGPNIDKARKLSERCQLYDGRRLPYPDDYFARVGALNVLEHVQEPDDFIRELART